MQDEACFDYTGKTQQQKTAGKFQRFPIDFKKN